jgi:3-hydroxyisobutyrate dehydrogenase-like beta-hydroxyacid dehydrogenase
MRVALLGTGKMGAAIARRLHAAGHELALWNRTLERARELGVGRVAATPGEAAAGAEVVLSIVYDARAVREVYGALAPSRGQIFVEMSTAGPEVLDELASQIEEAGAELVACPIVGSIPAIEQASALLLVGGDPAAMECAGPVLEAFGQPQHVGSRREAIGLKLVNNAMLGGCSLLAAELLAVSGQAGLNQETAFRLLCRTMPYLDARRRGFLDHDHSRPLFELRGIRKDLDLALGLGREAGAAMPAVAQARELYALEEPAHGDDEITAIIELYRR